MRDVFFGLALQYDTGSMPAVALNKNGTALEVHKNEAGFSLYYRVGTLKKATVNWGPSTQYDNGTTPRCAINGTNVAVEVHKNQLGSTLYYRVGRIEGNQVNWGGSRDYDSGIEPAVALNDNNIVVEVHKTQSSLSNKLYYHVGRVNGNNVDWGPSYDYDSGSTPQVALNNSGVVVEVHKSQSQSTVWYHVGQVNGNNIDFGSSQQFGSGASPSVALTNGGDAIVTWVSDNKLMQRVGRVNGKSISWNNDGVEYDDGLNPSVAVANDMSIQVHPTETALFGLWYSTSILTNRASWMQDRLETLGNIPLSGLVLPASHDSGMYLYGIAILGKTQNLSIYGQLSYGVRWFDLRPKWTGSKFVIHHGPITGPDLSEVLDDIKRFANEGHRELAILKFSHFDNIDDNTYVQLANQIETALGPWLVKTIPGGKRLADVTLNEYVKNGPALLVLVDGNYAVKNRRPGFWVYRDWDASDPAVGELRVFDQYSNTTDFDKMKEDQFAKFNNYNGKCKNDPSVPCDLFLLSWTLTPPTAVWSFSKVANRNLGLAMTELRVPNGYGQIVNMLYVDYVEYARVTDVALFQNGQPFS
ncbi:MAG: hypothetical protein F6K48_12245 [Okeania sp. SIO3H1]|uniref:phosphatidylinositol-specific phospholipase C domain-containing protein n=1 Tax=Okeania sp. SIO1I7 TaxID=2607772 RepID=UPI0013C55722|nr:phosphatidylinositol-specific phospholipase C domain-containing protein [Okeania sp. SIO1I7]NEN89628.1 hypothetical protein [Okeania sp. SIO3H1]NET27652.1 hypothetical protein [Okeania sp. SIO1I7]